MIGGKFSATLDVPANNRGNCHNMAIVIIWQLLYKTYMPYICHNIAYICRPCGPHTVVTYHSGKSLILNPHDLVDGVEIHVVL